MVSGLRTWCDHYRKMRTDSGRRMNKRCKMGICWCPRRARTEGRACCLNIQSPNDNNSNDDDNSNSINNYIRNNNNKDFSEQ